MHRWRATQRGECVLLYSHDTYGLGHFRRNSAIAHALRRAQPNARIVMLTGSPLADGWRLPEGVELVRMPGAVKVGADDYRPVQPRSMSGLVAERADIIVSTLIAVRPDVFLVDHAPIGMKGELRWPLELARRRLPETRVILGLRDILDDPATVRETWTREGIYDVLASFYHGVLVYGSRELFDVAELYDFPPTLRRRTVFTGYVAKDYNFESNAGAPVPWTGNHNQARRVLVMGGGGGDAAELFEAFLDAWPGLSMSGDLEAALVTGPLMPTAVSRKIGAAAKGQARIHVVPWSFNMLQLVAAADVVVSMGGYNSVVEALSARRPLVVWPRLAPRREQLIRARMLERLGLARVVLPGPGAVGRLTKAIARAATDTPPGPEIWQRIDLGGGDRVARILLEFGRAKAMSG